MRPGGRIETFTVGGQVLISDAARKASSMGRSRPRAPLAVFGALQVLLPVAGARESGLVVDGKVTEISERDGVRTAMVRFTGVDWDTQARIESLARRA